MCLEWVFNVYDVDGNGVVTMDEIAEIMLCVQKTYEEQVDTRHTRSGDVSMH